MCVWSLLHPLFYPFPPLFSLKGDTAFYDDGSEDFGSDEECEHDDESNLGDIYDCDDACHEEHGVGVEMHLEFGDAIVSDGDA